MQQPSALRKTSSWQNQPPISCEFTRTPTMASYVRIQAATSCVNWTLRPSSCAVLSMAIVAGAIIKRGSAIPASRHWHSRAERCGAGHGLASCSSAQTCVTSFITGSGPSCQPDPSRKSPRNIFAAPRNLHVSISFLTSFLSLLLKRKICPVSSKLPHHRPYQTHLLGA